MSLIVTNSASCRDCYKCVRWCPVKAIRVIDGHAEVVEDLCIGDGRCIRVCPQRAKKVCSDLDLVRSLIRTGSTVVASLAPSFVSAIPGIEPMRFVTALKHLGFHAVCETAVGAEAVAEAHRKVVDEQGGMVITSSCPAIVNLITKYYPELTANLAPVVSPMVMHASMLKQAYGETAHVVFIGPCVAKIGEARSEEALGRVDAVITFADLFEWMAEEGIDARTAPVSQFDLCEARTARYFPVPGGLGRTAGMTTDILDEESIALSGLEECAAFLDSVRSGKVRFRIAELMACQGGCVNGPCIEVREAGLLVAPDAIRRRQQLISFASQAVEQAQAQAEESQQAERVQEGGLAGHAGRIHQVGPAGQIGHAQQTEQAGRDRQVARTRQKISLAGLEWRRSYPAEARHWRIPSEQQIREILAKIGKLSKADELNCGACGYPSCRDKAVAVFNGMAEAEMCMPYMRQRAESRAELIIRSTPNAIFVVDSNMRIVSVNPAAERIFVCRKESVVGSPLSSVIDPKCFIQALETRQLISGEASYPAYGVDVWQSVFYVEHDDLIIGIFVDITKEKRQQDRLDRVTEETLEKAQEVIDKQMRVAQEIAELLGETTAETKVLLTRLMELFQNEEGIGR